MSKIYIREFEAFDIVSYHNVASIDESDGHPAGRPVTTLIKLGCGFEEATLKRVLGKINRGEHPDPHSVVEKILHGKLLNAFRTTDLYAGVTCIDIFQEPAAHDAAETFPQMQMAA